MKCEFEIQRIEGQFQFVLKIDDKETIVSKPYKSKQSAIKGIKSMRRNIFCAHVNYTTNERKDN